MEKTELMERYSPMSAVVFAKIFEGANSKGLAKNLINAVLDDAHSEKIQEIIEIKSEYALLGNISPKTGEITKGGRLDIKAIDNNNRIFNIEIQVYQEPDMNDRSAFYFSKILTEAFQAGCHFSEMPRIILINFLKHGVRVNAENFHSVSGFIYEDSYPSQWATDLVKVHNIELDVFEKKYGKLQAEDLSELGVWLRYFLGGYKDEKEGVRLMEIAKNLKEFADMYDITVSDPELKRKYDFYMSGIRDENTRLSRAKREGEAIGEARGEARGEAIGKVQGEAIGKVQGEAIGVKKEKLETAKKMKAKGLAPEFISEVSGLDLSEVEKL